MFENLKYCREELEITQEKLGKVLNVHKSTISNWENNYEVIPFKKLVLLCNTYNISIDYIFGLRRNNIELKKIILDTKLIGRNLKRIRKKLNLTLEQLSKELDIHYTTLNKYENGDRLVSTLTLYTLCRKYKLSADKILNR